MVTYCPGVGENARMKSLLLGLAIGYVVGSRAGHERYDQLRRTYRNAADHPMVQGAAGVVRAKASELGERASGRAPRRGEGSRR
jgi:hypothetical protein